MAELPLVGDEFAGYRLRAVLGRGGMSVVYQGENPRLGSVIALKVLAPELATDDDDPDHVYLSDVGITKHAMSRTGLTSTGQFHGTIDYVAPEQIRGISVLGQADQYSLGCVLYECLTGRVPFEKDLDAAIIFAHVEESPTMPTGLRPDLPPAVYEVLARVLAKQPGDRYGSCREFIEAARVALGSLAPVAEPGASSGEYAPTLWPEQRESLEVGRARRGDTIICPSRSWPVARRSGGCSAMPSTCGWVIPGPSNFV